MTEEQFAALKEWVESLVKDECDRRSATDYAGMASWSAEVDLRKALGLPDYRP